MACTCQFGARCGGDGWLNCRGRAWGNCFCQCGCTEDCFGCEDCAQRDDYYDDFQEDEPPSGAGGQ